MSRTVRTLLFTLLLLILVTSLSAGEPQISTAAGRDLNVQLWTKYDWNASSGKDGAARFEILKSKEVTTLHINSAVANDARFVQELTVEPDTLYRLVCRARGENIGTSTRGAGISALEITDGSPDIKGSSKEWQSLEFYGKTGSNQRKLSVTVGIGGYGSLNSGKVWFKDISVEKVSNVPAGIRIAELQPATVSAPDHLADRNRNGGTVIIALGCIGLLLVGWGIVMRRRVGVVSENVQVQQLPAVAHHQKLALTDVAVMAALSAVCLLASLFNLGGHIAPETGWQPAEAGESVTIELGREVNLSRIYYYSGINERSGDGSRYSLSARNRSGTFVDLASFTKDDTNIWKFSEVATKTSAVRLTADIPGGRINEIAFVEKGGHLPLSGLKIADTNVSSAELGKPENLIDEQSAFEYAPSFRTGFYFDEIYHARTAWENLNHIEPYETTHPPLGKLLISFGIAVFGMNPFGWRIVGALFGVALVPLMYLFGLKLFRNRFYAFCGAFLMMVEFMRFAQSRVAVIDVYAVFFIMVMYYFILDLFPEKGEEPCRSVNLTLLLAGIAFGIGAACKWITLYAGCGMVFLVIFKTVAELRQRNTSAGQGIAGFLLRRIGVCLITFGVVPALIYLLAYLPYLALSGPGHGLTDIFRLQAHMLNYHRTLQATHPFSSPWWSWPLDLHPMWMYSGTGLPAETVSSIASFGNPAIFWLGIPAVATAAFLAVRRRDAGMGVVLVALLCQYLPWVGINRLAFIYHFFSTVPFLIICIVATLRNVELRFPRFRTITLAYLGVAGGLFILFYPVLSGLQVSGDYVASLRWFTTWIF